MKYRTVLNFVLETCTDTSIDTFLRRRGGPAVATFLEVI